MAERDEIRKYAHTLANHPVFLSVVLYHVASKIRHELLNLVDRQGPLDVEAIIDHHQLRYLERYFVDYLNQPEFWELCAEWILPKLEAWRMSGERPDLSETGGLASRFRDLGLSEEDADKEAELRDRYAPVAADFLVEKLDLPNCSVDELEDLLGLKVLRAKVKKSIHKLSQLQKNILTRLMEETKGVRHQSVRWNPTAWFGQLSDSDHAAIARSLKKLEARGLIIRRSKQGTVPERASYIQLTAIGYRATKVLVTEK